MGTPGRGKAGGAGGRRVKGAVSIAAIFLLAGCSVGPRYVRPSAPHAQGYQELAGWTVAHPAQIVPAAWWSVYHDTELDRLENRVVVSNETVRAAAAAYADARALVTEARAGFYPTLGVNTGVERQAGGRGGFGGSGRFPSGSETLTSYTLEGSGAWDLDFWGKVRRQVEGSVAAAQASAADLAAATLSEQAAVASDYFQLRASTALEELLKETVAAYQRSLRITENQAAAGIAAPSAVLAAEVQVRNAEASRINAGIASANFEHAIAVLIGEPPSALTLPPGPLATDVPVVPAGVPSTLLERRPDIAAAERVVAQQNAEIGVAVAAFYPNINLSAVFGYVGNPLGSLIEAANRVWSLGAAATENIFVGGARTAAVAAQRALYDQSVASYRQTVLTAFQGVEDQLSSLRILAAEAKAEDAAVAAAKQSVAITLNEFEAGTIAYTAVVVAQAALLADQEAQLTIREDRLIASVSLIENLGGGWTTSDLPSSRDLQRSTPLLP